MREALAATERKLAEEQAVAAEAEAFADTQAEENRCYVWTI